MPGCRRPRTASIVPTETRRAAQPLAMLGTRQRCQLRAAAKPLQSRRGEARLVALIAHEDQPPPRIAYVRIAPRRGRSAPPLEHIARDEERRRNHAVALALKL